MIKASIVAIDVDENGNIKVLTNYTDDQDELIQQGTSRYSFSVLPQIEDIKQLIKDDIDSHCNALITRLYGKKQNALNIDTLSSDLIGYNTTKIQSTIKTKDVVYTVDVDNIIDSKGI